MPHHLETAYQQLAQKVDKMNTLRKQLETSSKDEVRQSEALTHIENLHFERDSLQERLDEAERRLDELLQSNSKGSDGDDIGVQIYQKYDLAMDDLRAVKSENRQLREQLADAQNNATASGPPHVSSSGGFDWESQKAQLLAQLDGIDPNDAEQVQEKYKAKEAIRATEQAVAERDRQIAELQAQLEDKSQQQPDPSSCELNLCAQSDTYSYTECLGIPKFHHWDRFSPQMLAATRGKCVIIIAGPHVIFRWE